MNRYAKMALVLLYLLQLMVVFREQLEHMYESAIESVHKQRADSSHPEGHKPTVGLKDALGALGRAVENISRPPIRETISATSIFLVQAAIIAKYHPPHGDHHHDPDHHKDRPRRLRHRHGRRILIANLWNRIRVSIAPQLRDELAEPISRHLSFV